jgi:hypothetical protein
VVPILAGLAALAFLTILTRSTLREERVMADLRQQRLASLALNRGKYIVLIREGRELACGRLTAVGPEGMIYIDVRREPVPDSPPAPHDIRSVELDDELEYMYA